MFENVDGRTTDRRRSDSRGNKVGKMLTLAPERYTAKFCMVSKIILLII